MIQITARYNYEMSVIFQDMGTFPNKKDAVASLQRFANIRNSECSREIGNTRLGIFTLPFIKELRVVRVSRKVVGMRAGLVSGWHMERTGILRNPKVPKDYYPAYDNPTGYVEFAFEEI